MQPLRALSLHASPENARVTHARTDLRALWDAREAVKTGNPQKPEADKSASNTLTARDPTSRQTSTVVKISFEL